MRYYIKENGQTRGEAKEIPGLPTEVKDAAQMAAYDYEETNGVLESEWPLRMTVVDAKGHEWDCVVAREVNPNYIATIIGRVEHP